ncbi:MAG: hypothetical protein WCK72_05355 [Actinomycetes bacterium]
MAKRQSGDSMKEKFEIFKQSVTGRWCVSVISAAPLIPLGFAFALERESVLAPGRTGQQIMICVAGDLVGYFYLFVMQMVFLRTRYQKAQNFWLCVFIWSSTGLVRGLLADFYAHSVLNLPSHLAPRMINSAAFTGCSLLLAAFYFGTISQRRVKNHALNSLNGLLEIDSSQIEESHIQARKQAISGFQSALEPRIKQLQTLASGIEKLGTTQELNDAIARLKVQTQQLDWQLKSEVSKMEKNSFTTMQARENVLTRSPYMKGAFPSILSVRTSFVVLLLGGIVGQAFRNSLAGILVAIISSLLIITFLAASREVLRRFKSPIDSWIFPFVYLGVFGIQYFYSSFTAHPQFHLHAPYNPWYSGVKTIVGVYIASLISTLLAQQEDVFIRLAKKNQTRLIHDKANEAAAQDMTRVVVATNFGEIQGKVSGVIFALNLLTNSAEGGGFKPELTGYIANANALLTDAISDIRHLGVKEYSN